MTRRDWLRTWMLPASLAVSSCGRKRSPRYQGYALIANHDSRTIAVIDLSRFQRLKEVAVDAPPSWVIAASTRSRAYSISAESSTIDVLNLDNLLVEHRVLLGGKPQAVCISPDEKSLWVVLREPDLLAEFRTNSGAWGARVPLPSRGSDVDLRGEQIAIAFPEIRGVGRYLINKRRLDLSAGLGATPQLVRFRSDGKVLFTGNTEDRSITAISSDFSGSPLQVLVDLPLALKPRHLCFNSDGGQLFVTGEGMDAVAIVDTYDTEVNETILAGSAPGSMAATSAGPQYLFVANPQSGDATIISIENRRVLAQIQVGQRPGAVLLTPDNEYALILNEQSDDVAVIRLLNIRQADSAARRSRMAPLFTLIAVGAKPVSGAIAPRSS